MGSGDLLERDRVLDVDLEAAGVDELEDHLGVPIQVDYELTRSATTSSR